MESQLCKRPRTTISSCTTHNVINPQGKPLPCTYRLMEWIIMQASCKGPHKVAKSKRGSIEHQWKGRILSFKIDKDGRKLAQVQHVYMGKDMYLDPELHPRRFASHYVFPSNFVDWEPLGSFIGTFTAYHEDIGKLLDVGQASSSLVKKMVFWYNATYIVPTKKGDFGKLETIPIPQLRDVDCHMPDRDTVRVYKERMLNDVQGAMRFTFSSKWCRLSWFVPFHVFVFCFRSVEMRRTKTSWTCSDISATCKTLLGENWGSRKGEQKGDQFECHACEDNGVVRYHIARQTLYMAFQYRRWKKTRGQWLPLDSDVDNNDVDISIGMDGGHSHTIHVNYKWTLRDIRDHLLVMGDDMPESFVFKLNNKTVSKRLEKSMSFVKFGPPCVIQILNVD